MCRQQQDLNLRGQSPLHFECNALDHSAILTFLLLLLWVFGSLKETSDARQRLNHLNKALSEDASYGLGSLITQLGEEPGSKGYIETQSNYTSPPFKPARDLDSPAQKNKKDTSI